jgi:hypothetical protein
MRGGHERYLFYKSTSVRIMIVITDGDDTDGVRTPTEGLVS